MKTKRISTFFALLAATLYAVNIPLYYMAQLYAWDPALDAKPGCYYQYIQYWNWT